ncbi:MAG: HprK-related kinase B [Pseudomonadota bacterium]|nr:HprK-related kinase B [Pseudomonadota bacterium]
METDLDSVARLLQNNAPLCDEALYLAIGNCKLRLRSNSAQLLDGLRGYFAHVVSAAQSPDMDVIAVERDVVDVGVDFIDWKREPGKSGRKDACLDIPDGRLVRKVRTGMLFLQSETCRIAAGPCIEYDNQVINFINAQYMNWLQQRSWLICHAAALVYQGRGFAIAGLSGGGKSTLMLNLLDHDSVSYITNDRLFIKKCAGETRAVGIPKLPRINPGTIVHNPRLQQLIEPQRRESLLALPPQELWELEDKYDVDVKTIYGAGRIVQEAPLSAFLILNWQRDADAASQFAAVDLASRRDLLAAIMKSSGPFYQYADGSFFQDDAPLDEQVYLDALDGVSVFEASGQVDFDGLTRRLIEELIG